MRPESCTPILIFIVNLTVFVTVKLPAQPTIHLEDHVLFFEKLTDQFRVVLDSSGLSEVVEIDTVAISAKKLVFKFIIPDKANLSSLNRTLDSLTGQAFEAVMFDKAQLLSDLPAQNIRLSFSGKDAVINVESGPKNNGLVTSIKDKMGETSDGIILPLNGLKLNISQISTDRNGSFKEMKKLLTKGLASFFKQKNSSWFQSSNLEVVSDFKPDELVLRVTNAKDIVLKLGHFEYLRMSFRFSVENEQLQLNYTVDGKYGAGILWAPFDQDYYPMSPKYEAELRFFSSETLKTTISNIFSAK